MLDRPIRRTAAAALALSLLAVSCGDSSSDNAASTVAPAPTRPIEVTAPTESTPASEQPTATASATTTPVSQLESASISVVADESAAVAATIGFAGGTVTTQSADATTFTLIVPEGALLDDTEIAMAPIAEASGAALGDSPVLGVTLEPEGLHFLRPAALEITGPAVPPDAVAFSAGGDGADFHLVQSTADAGTAVVSVTHFSVVGIGNRQLVELAQRHRPQRVPEWAIQALALAEALPEDARKEALKAVVDQWLSQLITTLEMPGSLAQLERPTVDVKELTNVVFGTIFVTGPNEQFEEKLAKIYALWGTRTSEAISRLSTRCRAGELEAGFEIARWWTIATFFEESFANSQIGLPAPDYPLTEWVQQAAACFTFSTRWAVTITNEGAGITTPFEADVAATLPDFSSTDAAQWVQSLITTGSSDVSAPSALNVTDGPFGVCTGAAGGAGLGLEIDTRIPNLGDVGGATIRGMTGVVGLKTPIEVECPQLLGVDAPVADVFFVDPLTRFNDPWAGSADGFDVVFAFPLELGDRTGGEIGRFEHDAELAGTPSSFQIAEEFTVRLASP